MPAARFDPSPTGSGCSCGATTNVIARQVSANSALPAWVVRAPPARQRAAGQRWPAFFLVGKISSAADDVAALAQVLLEGEIAHRRVQVSVALVSLGTVVG